MLITPRMRVRWLGDFSVDVSSGLLLVVQGSFARTFYQFEWRVLPIHLDLSVAVTSVVIAIISIGIATWMYKNAKQPVANALAKRFNGLWTAAYHRFYIDDIYQFITHKIIFRCISTPIAWFDRHVVDGFFNFLAWATNTTSDEIRGLQSGQVQQYAYVFLCGALALILLLVL